VDLTGYTRKRLNGLRIGSGRGELDGWMDGWTARVGDRSRRRAAEPDRECFALRLSAEASLPYPSSVIDRAISSSKFLTVYPTTPPPAAVKSIYWDRIRVGVLALRDGYRLMTRQRTWIITDFFVPWSMSTDGNVLYVS
jgi:hypothetical protein